MIYKDRFSHLEVTGSFMYVGLQLPFIIHRNNFCRCWFNTLRHLCKRMRCCEQFVPHDQSFISSIYVVAVCQRARSRLNKWLVDTVHTATVHVRTIAAWRSVW